jgi:hypothetical protein
MKVTVLRQVKIRHIFKNHLYRIYPFPFIAMHVIMMDLFKL